jgi:hypothetical protein
VSEGDIICLKQNTLCWWNLESETNKRKRTDDNANVPGGSVQTDAPCTPLNLRVCFEKKYYDGGHMRLYGLQITPGKLPDGNDFDWMYFCEVCSLYVPLPDGYVPVLNVPVIL